VRYLPYRIIVISFARRVVVFNGICISLSNHVHGLCFVFDAGPSNDTRAPSSHRQHQFDLSEACPQYLSSTTPSLTQSTFLTLPSLPRQPPPFRPLYIPYTLPSPSLSLTTRFTSLAGSPSLPIPIPPSASPGLLAGIILRPIWNTVRCGSRLSLSRRGESSRCCCGCSPLFRARWFAPPESAVS
jgi:hypothetical protein